MSGHSEAGWAGQGRGVECGVEYGECVAEYSEFAWGAE